MMTNKLIVASFDNETAAFEAAQEIEAIGKRGLITIKRGAIVSKDANGKWSVPAAKTVRSSWLPLSGEPAGVLLGLLVGQAAAFAVPMADRGDGEGSDPVAELSVGVSGDSLSDVVSGQLASGALLRAVGSQIEPGQTVCLAEIDEGSSEPIDKAVTGRGGRVFRTDRCIPQERRG
jgi:uncharacterized membrane protein